MKSAYFVRFEPGKTNLAFLESEREKGVWIEKSPACRPPQLHSTTRHLELDQQGDVNSDRVIGDLKSDKLLCQVFAVIVPGSQVQNSQISETVICID